MATDYISREAAADALRPYKIDPFKIGFLDDNIDGFSDGIDTAISKLSVMPGADVVSRDCYDRIIAENDTMREMLAQIGKKPGDKMDDVRPVKMATREELFAAVRLIRATCAKVYKRRDVGCSTCILWNYCKNAGGFGVPCEDWPDPAEGGSI